MNKGFVLVSICILISLCPKPTMGQLSLASLKSNSADDFVNVEVRRESILFYNSNDPSFIQSIPDLNQRDFVLASDDDTSTGIKLQDFAFGGETYSMVSTNSSSSLGGGKFIIFNDTGAGAAAERVRFTVDQSGQIGIGTHLPRESFHLRSGNVYIEQRDASIIMTSPNGSCWELKVDNNGQLNTTSASCP